jgi:hypothetical protein
VALACGGENPPRQPPRTAWAEVSKGAPTESFLGTRGCAGDAVGGETEKIVAASFREGHAFANKEGREGKQPLNLSAK